ncbi:ATP-grasp domain-containing protein [Streptomyces sp. WAC08241]|uniref:D-alanine--D-alanine ligase family protein n=1 Tax=Streptomyces sp. WAC08241 TaxID=2487421 RepID=UPI0037DD3B17
MLASCDVVFPAVHGPLGEDGTLAALCELAGLPYVGSGLRAGALAMDKPTTKLIARQAGLAVARAVTVTDTGAPPLPLPVVVKPVAAGSSHGVTLVDAPERYDTAVSAALALDTRVLVEEYVHGREVDIAVLRRPDGTLLTGPVLEVVNPGNSLFDTRRKYDGSAQFLLPAPLNTEQVRQLEDAATKLYRELGCDGVARTDFFLTPDGRLVLNEVNTMPGMTAESQVPKMFTAAGLPYPDLLAELLDGARRRRR